MESIIIYSIIQVITLLFAFICIGGAISDKATKFDKVLYLVWCTVFILVTIYVQGVLK